MKRQVRLAAGQLPFALLLCLIGASGWAQRINAITFDKLPQDYQLYPRNAQSEAQIPISGRVGEPGWQHVSVQVFRNKQAIGYRRAAISYSGEVGRFTVEPITIRAERAEYSVKLHLVKGTDSTHVVERSNLVAGDVYVLTGQSNASSYFKETRTNEFCRTFGKTSGTYGADPGNSADTVWAVSNQQLLTQDVGTFGFEFQQLILEKYGIPTCLVNGAMHWSMMAHHANRTPNNPADLTNPYGRLLYRLQKGGLDKSVKALVYRQGESEAYGEGNNWGSYFDVFYANLKLDLPSISRLYVYQIDIIDPAIAVAPLVRETQRNLVNKYPDVQVLASVGTPGFDGLHYSDAGYIQNAQELTQLIARDFYNAPGVDNIDAPNIRRAYYANEARNEIVLRFNDGQEMGWPAQSGNRQPKDIFYVDGREGEVTAGRAVGNRIVLTLKNSSSATRLTYLPPKIDPGAPDFPYRGPYLTNKRGLRALSFYELPIGNPVPPLTAPTLAVIPASEFAMQLSWNAVTGATGYLLEIKDPQSDAFRLLKQLPAGTLAYLASGLSENTAYMFRVQAVGVDTESPWNQVDGRTPALLKAPVVQGEATFATTVALSWQPVQEALGYVVERRSAPETGFTSLTTVGGETLSFSDRSAVANSAYTYRVKATGRYTDSPFGLVSAQTPAFLAQPELVVGVVYNNALQLNWTTVPDATGYQLTRKAPNGSSQVLGTFSATTTAIKDTNLLAGTTYTYQLKALGNRTESPMVNTSAATPALLETPALSPVIVYNNALKLSWKGISDAETYQLERKTPDQEFRPAGTFKSDMLSVSDTNLVPGTRYSYRLRALGRYSESLFATVTVEMPAILATPALSLSVVYNNAVTVSWPAVPNATAYRLERQVAAQAYQPVGTLKAGVLLFQDIDLTPATAYTYRLTAIGDRTASPSVSASAVTPDLLSAPDHLLVTPVSYDAISLTWTASPNATHYLLDRKTAGANTYEHTVRIEASQNQYTDARLAPSTEYQYRLTAYGNRTQSPATVGAGTTLILLGVEPDPAITLRLWPNPATGGQVSLHFSAAVSGRLQLLDLRGVVQQEQEVANATQVPLTVVGYPAGGYLIRLIRATDTIVQKLLIH